MKTNPIIGITSLCALVVFVFAGSFAALADDTNQPTKAEKEQAVKEPKAFKDRHYAADPTKVKFGEFKTVELKVTELPAKENSKSNQKSAKKIDEMLVTQLKDIWPDIKLVPAGGEFSKGGERTLQIAPRIEHIHIVGPGGRIWWGVMAGGSDLVMHVDFRDSTTGEIIAQPDFWKGNNAWAGGTTWGTTDNKIRDAVVEQIANYTRSNK